MSFVIHTHSSVRTVCIKHRQFQVQRFLPIKFIQGPTGAKKKKLLAIRMEINGLLPGKTFKPSFLTWLWTKNCVSVSSKLAAKQQNHKLQSPKKITYQLTFPLPNKVHCNKFNLDHFPSKISVHWLNDQICNFPAGQTSKLLVKKKKKVIKAVSLFLR